MALVGPLSSVRWLQLEDNHLLQESQVMSASHCSHRSSTWLTMCMVMTMPIAKPQIQIHQKRYDTAWYNMFDNIFEPAHPCINTGLVSPVIHIDLCGVAPLKLVNYTLCTLQLLLERTDAGELCVCLNSMPTSTALIFSFLCSAGAPLAWSSVWCRLRTAHNLCRWQ